MKRQAKSAGLFVSGALFGLILGGGYMARDKTQAVQASDKNFTATYLLRVSLDINTAALFRQGKADKVLRLKEEFLPLDIRNIHDNYRNHAGATEILQRAKKYYKDYKVPVPAQIKPIFDALP